MMFRNEAWGFAGLLMLVLSVGTPGSSLATDELPLGSRTEPAYYRVTGVASDDVLNVRIAPDAGSEIVGSLRPGASPVEVVEVRGNWARVSEIDISGWASLRYLQPIELASVGKSRLPVGLFCGGTEPFWSLSIDSAAQAKFSAPDIPEVNYGIVGSGDFGGRPTLDYLWLRGSGSTATAFISRQFCSDGMSDRLYGYHIGFTHMGDDGASWGMEGCCRVPVSGQ